MCSCTSCTARALGCRVGRLLGLLLGVRGLCAPKLGRKTTGMRVVLLLLGPGSGSSRSSLHCSPPSGLALLADSASLSGVALAGSALPQSTSSSWPSFSSAWVAVVVASFAVGCGVFSASSVLPPLCCSTLAFGYVLALLVFPRMAGSRRSPCPCFLRAFTFGRTLCLCLAWCLQPLHSPSPRLRVGHRFSSAWVAVVVASWASFAVGCGVFSASSVLPPPLLLDLGFPALCLLFESSPAWPAVAGLPVLAFIFRRMRRAFVRRPLISCGNRIM